MTIDIIPNNVTIYTAFKKVSTELFTTLSPRIELQ